MKEGRISIGSAVLEYHKWGCRTVFADGAAVDSIPHPNDHHYTVIAHRCGYGDDVWAYCVEHDAMHLFCEYWFHGRPSQVLWALAHGKMLSGKEAAYEESMAQVAQRWVRANEQPILSGVDWFAFKQAALRLLEGIG